MTVSRRAAGLGCALAVLLAGSRAAADGPARKVVAEVVPLGLKSADPDYVRGLMHTKPGKPYDDDVITQDVQRLHNARLFVPNSVEVSTAPTADGRVTVFVKLQELAGITQEVVYHGAEHFSDEELSNLTGLRRGGPMSPAANRLAQQTLLNKLREDGRYYASVDLVEGSKVTDTRVVFHIVEGPVVRVRSIRFAGNQVASSGRLQTQVVTSSAMIPGVVTALTSKLQRASIDEDRRLLVIYYHRMGYLDVEVKDEVVPVHGGSAVDIVYHIREGGPYRVNAVRIEGSKSVTPEELRRVTAAKTGEVYDLAVMQNDERRIEARCGNGGHFTRVAHQTFAVPGQPGAVDVVYRVEQRSAEPDRVGRVIIQGNRVTKDNVILNEVGLYPGQILQYPQLEIARQNLLRRNLFDPNNPPTVVPLPANENGFTDILVTVNETQTGMFAVQANVNSDAGVNGSIVVNQRNFDILRVPRSLDDLLAGKAFIGGGQELRIQAQPGTVFQNYSVSLREPYLFDSRFALTVGGSYFTRDYLEYEEERLGIRAAVNYRLDNPAWQASLGTRFESVDVTGIQSYTPRSIAEDAGNSTLFGVRAGITRDTRDSYLLPTSGSYVDVGVEQVLGDYTFPIGTLEATKFFTAWQRKDGSGKHVFSNRTQLTVMGQNAPVFERVYAGGIRSFRGFDFRGVGPFENGLNTGGTFAWLNSHEYQIPVLANDKLYLAFFCDHGTVERDVRIENYRVSLGAGIRLQVPALGPLPIALDFGFPLTQGPSDNKQVFSFYMGWGIGS